MADEIDRVRRYAPTSTICRGWRVPVLQWLIHPPGSHDASPLVPHCTALELVTARGSSWWGVEGGEINSELRMVVWGFPARCEIRSAWPEAVER